MRIEDIDQNLKVETNIQRDNLVWLNVREAPFAIHGLYHPTEPSAFHRMDPAVADAANEGVSGLNWHTAGGRIRFATDSPYIALQAVQPASATMSHITKLGQSGFDLYTQKDGRYSYVASLIPPYGQLPGFSSIADFGHAEMRDYTIHMPLYDGVNELYIGLARGSEIREAAPYTHQTPVLYYGSSITQDGCASRPGNGYQAMIARKYDADFINLGFSGSARGEKVMAEYLASIPCSVFVCDYDHNAPSVEHLRNTHEPLYGTFRAAQPDTPVVFVSKPDFRPGTEDEARRAIIRTTYETALAEGDKNVYYIDGETLFAGEWRDSCTVDGCHPNDLGFSRMATVIGNVVGSLL